MGHSSEIRVWVLNIVQTPLSCRYTMKMQESPALDAVCEEQPVPGELLRGEAGSIVGAAISVGSNMEMLMDKILLPVDFPNVPLGVVHQAAFLARHFHSEIILLHVVAPLSFPVVVLESGDELTARDLHSHIVQRVQKDGSSAAAGA